MLDFVLYTCSYGEVTVQTIIGVEKLHNTNYKFEWWFQTGDALIARSRSIAAYQFLKKNVSPYMIFLDGDITFTPEHIKKLIDALMEGYDAVGGLYPVKGAGFLAQRGWDGKLAITGEIEEAQFVSTGFLGISRKILEEITKEMPILNKGSWSECYPIFESGRYENIYISEDWDFCNKVRQAGSKVYAHTGIQLGHMKEQVYTAQEAIERTSWKPGRMDIWADLSEYLGKPIQELISEDSAVEQLAERWKSWGGSTEDFYKDPHNGLLYLYDETGFNSGAFYKERRLADINNVEHLNILDIGCGIGTALLELCWRNRNLVGYDIGETVLGFANYRKNKLGAGNVTFTNQFPDDLAQFDLVIAIDVLEHIEDLRSFLLRLGKGIRKGARFYHYDCFWEREVSPMHFDHSKQIDQWLEEAGFVIFDPHWAIKQ